MRYEVDSVEVARAAASIQTSAQQLNTEVDRMMRQLLDLQSCWRGNAAQSFQEVINSWRITQERVRGSLEEIHGCLAQAGQRYQEVEDAAVHLFR